MKTEKSKIEKIISSLITWALFLLFIYAGFSKMSLGASTFQSQLLQSPLIPRDLTKYVAIILPTFEIGLACLLLFDKTKTIGYYLSFGTMLFFSLYLIALVTFFENVPCACGGILGKMSYSVHIIFNVLFTIISFIAIKLQERKPKELISFINS